MSKYKLEFKLKQHTPLIHFQHEQHGATLRATEVKPKLDKFILIKLGEENLKGDNLSEEAYYNKGKEIAKKRGWLIGNEEHPSLEYKMKIEARDRENSINDLINVNVGKNRKGEDTLLYKNLGTFFGNLMKLEEFITEEKKQKKVTYFNDIVLSCLSFNIDILNMLKVKLAEFLAITNFGTRQSKGFGKFYIDKKDSNYRPINDNWFNYKIEVQSKNFVELFEKISIFYDTLRSGINLKRPKKEGKKNVFKDGLMVMEDLFYMKPVIFMYYKARGIQWEKKTIKESFFNKDVWGNGKKRFIGLSSQRDSRTDSEVLNYKSNKEKIVKDVLGLSIKEEWKSYNATIKKESVSGNIERFMSPLIICPIQLSKEKYIIYIKFNQNVRIDGKYFIISNARFARNRPFQRPVVDDFNLEEFFSYLKKIDIRKQYSIYEANNNKVINIQNTIHEFYDNIQKV